mgnify:CR=1 FL=1
MKNADIQAGIRRVFAREAPDALDGILSDCDHAKGTVMVMETKKRNPWVMRTVGIAAAVALCAMGGLGAHLYGSRFSVASTVSLDVNPSIEIQVNEKEHVLQVNPKNEDGRKVVGNMDFSGSSLDVTVNALIGSMLRNGYLNENANSILVSVDSADQVKGAALRDRLAGEINSLLQTDSFSGAVLSQTVAADDSLQQLADEYGISLGKAQLIQELTALNPTYTFNALAGLSINELNLLMAQNAKPENVASSGTASDKAYIGVEEAQTIALAHADVAAGNAVIREAKLDTEDGVLVYEIEFTADGYEYEYDIDAASGSVVKFEKERDDDSRPASTQTGGTASTSPHTNTGSGGTPTAGAGTDIGPDKAKEVALAHAGVAASAIWDYQIERDRYNGVEVYEIEFKAGGFEYDYDIQVSTGEVVKFSREQDDDSRPASSGSGASGTDIGQDKAKEAALAHAGVNAADIRNYQAERDMDDGVWIYEIEFKAGGYEYEYEVRAADGAVLKADRELDD